MTENEKKGYRKVTENEKKGLPQNDPKKEVSGLPLLPIPFCSTLNGTGDSPSGGCVTCALWLRVVFPLTGPGKQPGRKSPKNEEKFQIPLPGPTPENGEKLHKNYKICIFGVILPLFWGNFPHFRGSDRGGSFVTFPIFRGFPPRWLPGPL